MKLTKNQRQCIDRLKEAEEICKPLKDEVFKKHPYHKDIWVSDIGRVISRCTSYPHLKKAVIWKPSPYKYIIINPGRLKTYIHTLVAETFIGLRPEGLTKSGKRPLYTISHLDNDPINNNVDNLEWTTMLSNLKNSPAWIGNLKGKDHPATKNVDDVVLSWTKMYEEQNMTINAIATIAKVNWITVKRGIDRVKLMGNNNGQ